MESVIEIEAAIKRLPPKQIFKLAERLEQRLANAWDRQLSTDISSGRLNNIAQKTLDEHRAGRSKPFPNQKK